MSLVILKIGRYDPQFKSILVIGLGIILAVVVGAGLNRDVVSLPAGLKKLSVLTMIVLSAGATYLSGGAGSQLSPFVFGLLLGSIFGTGIPVYTYLETSRIMKTPATYQGRSTALLRFVGIFLTLIMALVLGFFEGRVKSSVALYFSVGAILLVIFCLVLLQSARKKMPDTQKISELLLRDFCFIYLLAWVAWYGNLAGQNLAAGSLCLLPN